jgi:hypothetical protein
LWFFSSPGVRIFTVNIVLSAAMFLLPSQVFRPLVRFSGGAAEGIAAFIWCIGGATVRGMLSFAQNDENF